MPTEGAQRGTFAQGLVSRFLGPRVPDKVLGRTVPSRFRSRWLLLADPVVVLVDFVEWLDHVPPPQPTRGDKATEERTTLIEACVRLLNLLPDEGVQQVLGTALEGAGVHRLSPGNEPYDSEKHELWDSVPTPEPSLHNMIERTERPGYEDEERLYQSPLVVVYRHEEKP